MKLAIFLVFSIFTFIVSAKTGSLGDWIGDYNKCFDTAISNNRQSIDVQKTRDLCQSQVQRRYQLEDKDAKFLATFEKLSGSNRINLHIISEGQEKKIMIFYNGICLENPEPLKKLQLSAAEISDKLVDEANLNQDNAQCLVKPDEPMLGFREKDGKCLRICLDGEVLESLISDEDMYRYQFRCIRCDQLIRESNVISEQKKAQYVLTHTQTSSTTNECEDFRGCKMGEEHKGGKCRKECRDKWIRNSKTFECEKGPEVCPQQFVEANRSADQRFRLWRDGITRSSLPASCRQDVINIMVQAQNSIRQKLQRTFQDCQRDRTTNTYFDTYSSFESEIDDAQRMRITNTCGVSIDEFSMIIDPPAAPERFLEDYPQ